jgi:hypothetical protein
LCLIDTETGKVAMEFDQQKRTSGIAWNPFVPGQFFTISTLRSSIDIWNVSQKSFIAVIRTSFVNDDTL